MVNPTLYVLSYTLKSIHVSIKTGIYIIQPLKVLYSTTLMYQEPEIHVYSLTCLFILNTP